MKRILVIEGDALARDFTEALLRGEGYAVDACADGPTGLRMYRERWYDLVVLDVFLPGLAGFDALLGIGPDRTGTPVIVLSGGRATTMAGRLHLAVHLGAARGFPRIYETGEFLAAVRDLAGEGSAAGGESARGAGTASAEGGA